MEWLLVSRSLCDSSYTEKLPRVMGDAADFGNASVWHV